MVTWRQRLRDLLCVKSIVTILLTVVFVALTLAGRVSSQEFLTIFQSVAQRRSKGWEASR